MPESAERSNRSYYLDWLRVLVIFNLVPYHVAWMMTRIDGFSHIPQAGLGASLLNYYLVFFAIWHMALLFFLAGATANISLSHRRPVEYLVERVNRLLVPLIFFMVMLYPLMVYFLPGLPGSRSLSDYLLSFWPQCLRTPRSNWPVGRPAIPAWGHLWFVAYLSVISIVGLPVWLYLRNRTANGPTGRLLNLCERKGAILLLALPFSLIVVTLAPRWPLFRQHTLYQDWAFFLYNLVAFALGYVLCADGRFWHTVDRHAKISLLLAPACSVIVLVMRFKLPAYSTPTYSLRYTPFPLFFGFNTWLWILALLGVARRLLSRTNRLLDYCSRACYPFYILHLVYLVIIGHFVVQWRLGVFSEFALLSVLTLAATLGSYDLVVRRTKTARFLFGMKA